MKNYQKEAEKIFMEVLQDPFVSENHHPPIRKLADYLDEIFYSKYNISVYYPLRNNEHDAVQCIYLADERPLASLHHFYSLEEAYEVYWINEFNLYDFVGRENLIYIENNFALNAKNCINFL